MSDPISGADAVGTDVLQGSLQDLTQEVNQASLNRQDLEVAFETALEKAIERPNFASVSAQSPAYVAEVSAASSNPANRPTAPSNSPDAETSEMVQARQEERMRALYTDLTDYQIAWKIAQKVQQDISQVLRGT